MLILHLFGSYAHVNLCRFFLPPGVGGWRRLLLVALPELLCLPLWCLLLEDASYNKQVLKGHFSPHSWEDINPEITSARCYILQEFISYF